MALIDNSEDEILAVVEEMEARVNNTWVEAEEDQVLLDRFKTLTPFSMVADNHVILENPERFYTKPGTEFLRNHQSWIQ